MANEQNRNQRMANQMRNRVSPSNQSAKDMTGTMKRLPGPMRPGNVGAINRVFWPFWFTSNFVEMEINTSSQANISITQEAAFVWMAYSKTVYKRTGTSPNYVYTYVDSQNFAAAGQCDGLAFTLRDSSSTRTFHNEPLDTDQVGDGLTPSVLPTPMMMLPNSTIETTFFNNSGTEVFVPFITFFGYRVRYDEAANLLSMVTG